jgi:hypothetical protein
MKLFHTCGEPLCFNHEVIIKLSSYFSYSDGIINLNKHVIRTTVGTNPIVLVDNKTVFHCTHCRVDALMKDSLTQCDDCRALVSLSDAEKVGESLVMCKRCAMRQKQFMEFLIFNQDKKIESESENLDEAAPPRDSRRIRLTGVAEIALPSEEEVTEYLGVNRSVDLSDSEEPEYEEEDFDETEDV